MPMKPKTKVMAAGTMLTLTIGFGALFIYIEEKKYEALYYQKELEKLQQQRSDEAAGVHHLLAELAGRNPHLSTLFASPQLRGLSETEAEAVVRALTNTRGGQSHALLREQFSLNDQEIRALQALAEGQP